MRVLTVGNMYPPHHLGGYEIVWRSGVEHLRDAGHEVRVLTTGFELPGLTGVKPQTDVFRELQWYWEDGAWRQLSLRDRLLLERHNATVFERHRRELRPDVVCWWAMGGMSLSLIERARRAGLASAFVVCDDWLLYAPQVDAWLRAMGRIPVPRAWVERATGIPARVDAADAGPWLFPSETVLERALQAGWALRETTVCHQGVDRSIFPPAPVQDWAWRLLYVGRIDERKGVDLAVLALGQLPEATLDVVGMGDQDYLGELKRLVCEHGLEGRVTFSHHRRDELHLEYARSDAVLFPVRWKEPWGLVPLEAMAVGRPVIATGRGGSGEYLSDRDNCLLFDPDAGPAALSAAVRELAADSALRSRLRKRGFETTARFEAGDFDQAVEQLLARALK